MEISFGDKEIIKHINEGDYFVAVEEMPEPIGGMYGCQSKIKYPEIAKRAGIEGKVYVLALIDEDGNVASARIIKGIGAGCDEAALDAVTPKLSLSQVDKKVNCSKSTGFDSHSF